MRKHKVVSISAQGRDHGKNFLIVEKSAFACEKWATKALLALGRSGAEVSDEVVEAGMLSVLSAGLSAFRRMAFADAEPLLDEMMECVSFVIDTSKVDPVTQRPFTRPLLLGDDGDVEEVATLLQLRGEALELHTGFSVTAALSGLAAAVQNSNRQTTPTSRRSSAQSSKPAGRRSRTSKASTD